MITDLTLDQALIEIKRTEYALLKLRADRRKAGNANGHPDNWHHVDQVKSHAAAKRASMDLTRKLADLRAGR